MPSKSLDLQEKDYSKKEYPPQMVKRIRYPQWFWRSKKREELHKKIFNEPPKDIQTMPLFPGDERIKSIIRELADSNAVINNKIHHWTTIDNFKGIIASQYFYGHALLKKHNLRFQPNALVDEDIENGDGQVICFCPYLVDPNCVSKLGEQREGLIRLTVDLNKIENQGKYNQFVKLYDFQSPAFRYLVKITEQLSVCIIHIVCSIERYLFVEITLSSQKVTIEIEKKDAIFYGELHSINLFCLTRLFYLLEGMENTAFKTELKDYLLSRNSAELKKILVIFAQALTLHSEYNFNGALKLTNNLITDVYLPNDNRFVDLTNLSPSQYLAAIVDTKSNRSYTNLNAPLLLIKSQTIPPAESDDEEEEIKYPELYGFKIYSRVYGLKESKANDFTALPVVNFCKGRYYETRPVLSEPFSKLEDYLINLECMETTPKEKNKQALEGAQPLKRNVAQIRDSKLSDEEEYSSKQMKR